MFRSQSPILFPPNSVGITYVTGCHTLTLPDIECKHLALSAAWIALLRYGISAKFPRGGEDISTWPGD